MEEMIESRVPMVSRLGVSILALVALAAMPGSLDPDVIDVVDSGTLALSEKGVPIGEENFVIREDRGGADLLYRSASEANLKVNNQTMRVTVELEVAGPRSVPRRYRVEVDGTEPESIAARLLSDRLRLDIRSPSGDEMREFMAKGRLVILERYMAHQYFYLPKVLGDAKSVHVSVVVPRERKQVQGTLEDRGSETKTAMGREMTLRHVALALASGETHHVWLQGDSVMRVEIPGREFTAVRATPRGR